MQGPANPVSSLDPALQCGDLGDIGYAPAQSCCDLQASVSESVRQALHKQKAACQAAARLLAAKVSAAEVSTAEPRHQQAASCAGQQAGSATQPHTSNHGGSTDQPLVTARTSSAAIGPRLHSASVIGQAALPTNTALQSCHQHVLEAEEAASKLSQQQANSHSGLVEPAMQMPGIGLPVGSAGSQAESSLSLQQSDEKRSKANASGDARPQLWQVMLHPLCLQSSTEPANVLCLTALACKAVTTTC